MVIDYVQHDLPPLAGEKDEGRFSHFGIEILNFIGGGIYFLGEKLGLFYVGKGLLNGPS